MQFTPSSPANAPQPPPAARLNHALLARPYPPKSVLRQQRNPCTLHPKSVTCTRTCRRDGTSSSRRRHRRFAAPPPSPSRRKRRRGPPLPNMERGPPPIGPRQRHFPLIPCRKCGEPRQDAEYHNGYLVASPPRERAQIFVTVQCSYSRD